MLALSITASTTNDQIEAAIPFLDMREHAIEMRDMAAAVISERGDQEAIQLHDVDGITVLYSPTWDYAYVNERSHGIGNSLILDNDCAGGAEGAARQWRGEDADA